MPRTGRPPGGRGPGAQIPDSLVPGVREAYADGCTASELAAQLNVTASTILSCVNGRTYRDLRGPISNGKGEHSAHGERNGRSKLDRRDVLKIRAEPTVERRYALSPQGTACVTGRSAKS
jgi:hypothetical protein